MPRVFNQKIKILYLMRIFSGADGRRASDVREGADRLSE